MTENDIFLLIIMLCVTVIPMCLVIVIVISRDIDGVIKQCDIIGKWAKKKLDRWASDE